MEPLGTCILKDLWFMNNTATSSGGAIFFTEGDGLAVNNSVFDRNVASTSGGAVHFEFRQAGDPNRFMHEFYRFWYHHPDSNKT